MSIVGLAHFIELAVFFIIGIQAFRYLFRKWNISLSDEGGDAMTIGCLQLWIDSGFRSAWRLLGVHANGVPDYTYWLIGA